MFYSCRSSGRLWYDSVDATLLEGGTTLHVPMVSRTVLCLRWCSVKKSRRLAAMLWVWNAVPVNNEHGPHVNIRCIHCNTQMMELTFTSIFQSRAWFMGPNLLPPKCKIQDVSKLASCEAENDIVSLASSFLTVQVFRFAFTGGGWLTFDQLEDQLDELNIQFVVWCRKIPLSWFKGLSCSRISITMQICIALAFLGLSDLLVFSLEGKLPNVAAWQWLNAWKGPVPFVSDRTPKFGESTSVVIISYRPFDLTYNCVGGLLGERMLKWQGLFEGN